MRKLIIAAVISCFAGAAAAQVKIDSSYNNTYYQGRMELFNSLKIPKKATVFLGNSITERGMWHELLPGKVIVNRGIGGDNTFGVLARIQPVIDSKPKKLFLLIGINDLSRNLPIDVIAANYEKIIVRFSEGTPKTKIFIQSVLPVNDDILTADYIKNKGHLIKELNARIGELARKYDLTFVNLYEIFNNGSGKLRSEYTKDGIHLVPAAYVRWVEFLKSEGHL